MKNRRVRRKKYGSAQSFTFMQSTDNGEVLMQKKNMSVMTEYVMQKSVTDIPFEEYVVYNNDRPVSTASSYQEVEYVPNTRSTPPAQDLWMDIGTPTRDHFYQQQSIDTSNRSAAFCAPNQNQQPPTYNAPANDTWPTATERTAAPPSPATPPASPSTMAFEESIGAAPVSESKSESEDFINDMRAILEGKKVFNSETKSMESKNAPSTAQSVPQFENKHAIFDQIAQSMEYAKAYDLGSIDMEQRFADFDKFKDVSANSPKKGPARAVAQSLSKDTAEDNMPNVGSMEFLSDLDAIVRAPGKSSDANTGATAAYDPASAATPENQPPAPVAAAPAPAANTTGGA